MSFYQFLTDSGISTDFPTLDGIQEREVLGLHPEIASRGDGRFPDTGVTLYSRSP